MTVMVIWYLFTLLILGHSCLCCCLGCLTILVLLFSKQWSVMSLSWHDRDITRVSASKLLSCRRAQLSLYVLYCNPFLRRIRLQTGGRTPSNKKSPPPPADHTWRHLTLTDQSGYSILMFRLTIFSLHNCSYSVIGYFCFQRAETTNHYTILD